MPSWIASAAWSGPTTRPRSEKLNSETAVVFLEPELAEALRRSFVENDLRYSREVTRELARSSRPRRA